MWAWPGWHRALWLGTPVTRGVAPQHQAVPLPAKREALLLPNAGKGTADAGKPGDRVSPGVANQRLCGGQRGLEQAWHMPWGGGGLGQLHSPAPGTCGCHGPPGLPVLTKAVQDVVKIIEIVIALLHDGPVAHGVVQPAVGVCHCAGTGRGDGWGKVTRQLVTLTEDRKFKQTKV